LRRISQIVLATSATSAILLLGAAAAQAGTGLQSYNTTIGKFGGAAYSGVQTKKYDDSDASVRSSSVGGNYTADVCVTASGASTCLGGTKTINDGSNVSLWNLAGAGGQVRLKFTDGFQWVNVQVTGSWASN
jgi:hypothetical protein